MSQTRLCFSQNCIKMWNVYEFQVFLSQELITISNTITKLENLAFRVLSVRFCWISSIFDLHSSQVRKICFTLDKFVAFSWDLLLAYILCRYFGILEVHKLHKIIIVCCYDLFYLKTEIVMRFRSMWDSHEKSLPHFLKFLRT